MKKPANKKAQIDVALTIGAIIVPLGAIFGALIFVWAMIGPLGDAGKLASVIAFDTATLADIAYSVPDDVKIHYVPPAQCSIIPDGPSQHKITCMNGFMNVTNLQYKVTTHDTKFPDWMGIGIIEDLPYSLEAEISVVVPSENLLDPNTGQPRDPPLRVSYPGFMNWNDKSMAEGGNPMKITEKSVEISKKRFSTFDALSDINSNKGTPLETLIHAAKEVCVANGSSDVNDLEVNLPPFYYLTFPTSSVAKACLNKKVFSADVARTRPPDDYSREIYCFELNSLGCIFDISALKTYSGADTGLVQPNTKESRCFPVDSASTAGNPPSVVFEIDGSSVVQVEGGCG